MNNRSDTRADASEVLPLECINWLSTSRRREKNRRPISGELVPLKPSSDRGEIERRCAVSPKKLHRRLELTNIAPSSSDTLDMVIGNVVPILSGLITTPCPMH